MNQIHGINNYLSVDISDWFYLVDALRKENIKTIQEAVDICRHELISIYQHTTDLQIMSMMYTHYLFLYALLEFEQSFSNNKSLF